MKAANMCSWKSAPMRYIKQRIAGLKFAGGIFSNITHDHLDYHKTFDEYIRVKKAF